MLAHPRQTLAASFLKFAVEQFLLGPPQLVSGVIEGFAHMLSETGLGLLQNHLQGSVGGRSSGGGAIADLTKDQQGQLTGEGATLHQICFKSTGAPAAGRAGWRNCGWRGLRGRRG